MKTGRSHTSGPVPWLGPPGLPLACPRLGLRARFAGKHRPVRLGKQAFGGCPRSPGGRADGCRDAAQRVRSGFEAGHQAADPAGGLGLVGPHQDDAELVAAYAGDYVSLPDAFGENPRRLAQDLVSGGMSEAVIDRLERVEIDEQDRQGRAVAARHRDLPVQFPQEGAPVEDRAERIMVRERPRPFKLRRQAVEAFGERGIGRDELADHLQGAGIEVRRRKAGVRAVLAPCRRIVAASGHGPDYRGRMRAGQRRSA